MPDGLLNALIPCLLGNPNYCFKRSNFSNSVVVSSDITLKKKIKITGMKTLM